MLNRDCLIFRAVAVLLIVATFWTPLGVTVNNARVLGLLMNLGVATAYAEDNILSGADAGRAGGSPATQ